MSYYVPPSPPPFARGRAYSMSHSTPYAYPSTMPATPYSMHNALTVPHYDGGFGMARSAPYYVTPTTRSRSHSRPRHGHSHRSHRHHHGHHRRSHSAVGTHRHRPSAHHDSQRFQTAVTSTRPYYHSRSIGERILNFFGLGNSNRYVDSRGRTSGRTKHKY